MASGRPGGVGTAKAARSATPGDSSAGYPPPPANAPADGPAAPGSPTYVFASC